MPFDTTRNQPINSLYDAISQLGIEPINLDYLDIYKTEQIKVNPPSVLYKYRDVIETSLFIVFITSVLEFCISFIFILARLDMIAFGIAITSLVFGTYAQIFSLDIKGEAKWHETNSINDVPDEIVCMARQIRRILPSCVFTTGKLIQNNIVLDPYFCVDHRSYRNREFVNERICLGIWDDSKIHAIAKILK